MLKDDIIKTIKSQKGIDGEKIASLLLPCLKISLEEDVAIAYSASKIGGLPPIFDQTYPSSHDVPLTFLAQISLVDICHLNNLLPKSGRLYFFVLTKDIGYRYPDRKNEFRVLYATDKAQGNNHGEFQAIPEYPIFFSEYYTFPSYQEHVFLKNNLTNDESLFIEDFESELQLSSECLPDIGHQVLGHPKAVQGTVRFFWAAKYLGIENFEAITKEERDRINQEEDKFLLLLQLDFLDPKIGIEHFGDSVAYFGIHEEDLANGNFDNVVLVMQNT